MAHSQYAKRYPLGKSIRDHARNRSHPNVDNEAISQRLEDLVKPCVYNQLAKDRSLEMRERILGLPLMLAVVLTLVWRQVPSARELNRMLARENLLWAKATSVSQQALSQRLLTFPAELFEQVLNELLLTLNQRWHQRKKRSLPLSVAHANRYFERLWIVDASNPRSGFASEAVGELQFAEALFRKLKSLESSTLGKLGGRICAVVDLKTRYPIKTWFDEKPYAHESNFVPDLLKRALERTASEAGAIRLGTGYQGNPILNLRLIEIRHGSSWYRYLTSVLEPDVLPPYVVSDLYSRRWRIEESFLLLKRLLGLSYLWTGSINGIKLQIWATWLFYSVLIDLADEVADELTLPFNSISVEMVFRGIYHFTQALNRGSTLNLITYLTAPDNRDLGIVKFPRRGRAKPPLNLSPNPS